MPGLLFRRRRLLVGGDELMVPYATSACGRTVWMVTLALGLALAAQMLLAGACREAGYLVFSYEGASIVVGVLSLLVECQIAYASTYGTIIDPGPRNDMLQKHFSRKTWLGLAQLLLAMCGTVLIFYVPFARGCKGNSVAVVASGLVLTAVSQYLDSGGMYCCWMAFTSADSIWMYDDGDEEYGVVRERHGLLAEMENQYQHFCQTACRFLAFCACSCNVFGGGEQEADFAHVSRVFSRMLSARRYVDVVATDIAAGLILVRHVQKAEDYKRRDELQGGPGVATYSTITTDPGLDVYPAEKSENNGTDNGTASHAPPPRPRPSSSSTRGTAVSAAERNAPGIVHGGGGRGDETGGHGLIGDGDENGDGGEGGGGSTGGEGRRGGGAGNARGEGGGGGVCPGKVPLGERPKKHRKYYKVSRDETMLDLTRGGDDWRTLQEVAHFTSYANVMYSVWGTLIIDPWTGIRRVIRRSGSWCPSFISRRGARQRGSLFRANSSKTRGLAGSASVSGDGGIGGSNDAARGDRLFSSDLPSLCEAEIRGDGWWGAHETALRSELPHGSELVLAHFNNCLDETPYCVAVDHTWQTIVITIRGSHSFEDFVVDAMAEPRSLESVGEEWGFDGRGMHAHEGILRRAEWIRRDLEESGVLQLLLGNTRTTASTFGAPRGEEKTAWGLLDAADRPGPGPGDSVGADGGGGGDRGGGSRGFTWKGRRASRRTQSGMRFSSLAPLASAIGGSGFCSGYALRAVGHSLGGGVAALLTLLLKPVYPTVRALAISPPGGLVSEGACREATEAMVTSVVLNDDVVPRMSAQTIELLADQVLEVLGRSRVSKLFVMRSLLQREEDAHRPELYLRLPGTQEKPRAEEGGGAEAAEGGRRGERRASRRRGRGGRVGGGGGDTRTILESPLGSSPATNSASAVAAAEDNFRRLGSGSGSGSGSDLSDAEQAARSTAPLFAGRRPSDATWLGDPVAGGGSGWRGPAEGAGEGVGGEEEEEAEAGEEGEGKRKGEAELRYHRQLRRYREYLQQERASRRHLNRLRLPGRILHLVNTDFVAERVSTHACEDGCLSCVCSVCCLVPTKNETDVDACCCTPGVGERRTRVFTPVWSSPDDLAEIKVTPAFLVDHSPDEIVRAVEEIARDLGVTT